MEMDELDACCGSPAYAAPELIEGKQGIGSEVRHPLSLSLASMDYI